MTILLKTSNTIIFIILALWHFYWASGGKLGMQYVVPIISADNPNPLFKPRPYMTVFVGLMLLGMAIAQWLPSTIAYWSNWALLLIFSARTVGDFHYVGIFKRVKSTTFSDADGRYFIPLCLFLAVGHLYLLNHN